MPPMTGATGTGGWNSITSPEAARARRLVRGLEDLAVLQESLLPALRLRLPNVLAATNARGALQARLIAAHRACMIAQPPVGLYRYPPGTLVDAGDREPYAVLTPDGLVREQMPPWADNPGALAAALAALRGGAARVAAPCLLAARYGDATWGHWLIEILPKIVLAEQMMPGRFSYVVPGRAIDGVGVAPGYAAAVRQSLDSHGIPPHRLLRLRHGQALLFDALFDLSGFGKIEGTRFPGPHPGVLAALRAGARGAALESRIPRPFLWRAGTLARGLTMTPDLAEGLRAGGFTIVDPAALSFGQQVNLFRQAEAVAGVLGSGFAGMIHAPLGLPVLTLAPERWDDTYFVALFQKLQLWLAELRGPSAGADAHVAPFLVDGGDFAHAAAALTALPPADGGLPPAPRWSDGLHARLRFGRGGTARPYLRAGWSHDEDGFTWSVGGASIVEIPHAVMPPRGAWLRLSGHPLEHKAGETGARLRAVVNGVACGAHWLSGLCHPAWFLPRDILARQDPIRIRFQHEWAERGADEAGAETRPLAIAVRELAFLHATPKLAREPYACRVAEAASAGMPARPAL